MTHTYRPWLIAGTLIVVLALAVVLGRFVFSPNVEPAGPAQAELLAESEPTATSTATLRASSTPTPTPTILATPAASTAVTPTLPPVAPVAPTPGPTVAPDLALEYSKLKPNEYLGYVAQRYGVSLAELVEHSRIENPDVVPIGQGLIIPHRPGRNTPDQVLLPDSELVYGPAYLDFDINAFANEQGGRLAQVSMTGSNGEQWSGADVVERVAMRYSVGPRVLLAMMEAGSGWVTDPDPQGLARDYPLGHTNGAPGLLPQLEWAASALNAGFYGWQDRGETAIRFEDGTLARGAPGLNPGTVAVQRALAADATFNQLPDRLAAFDAAYRQLFGDPMALDAGPVLPAGLEQPPLRLPWLPGEWWHLTGGPHGGWFSSSGWAALDFVPESAQIGNCVPAPSWAVAAAPGVVVRSTPGEILLDLDGDGDMRTGWVLQYLHIADQATVGAVLAQDDLVGRPSCDGGAAETTHLHFARRYNGLWVDAGGAVPMVLDGWTAFGGFEYEGGMVQAGLPERKAAHSRDRTVNGLLREE